jgi:predicted Rossmann-fold nucleotide-binding protein
LIQTTMIHRYPVVVFDRVYHQKLLEYIDDMVKNGTISPEDLELFMVTDDIEEAVEFISHNTIVPFGLKRMKKSKWLWEK